MELIKDYDFSIHYHSGKVNVVADALSRKSVGSLSCVRCARIEHFSEMKKLGVEFELKMEGALLARFYVRPLFVDQIREGRDVDEILLSKKKLVLDGGGGEF